MSKISNDYLHHPAGLGTTSRSSGLRNMTIVLSITAAVMVVEIIGGILAQSLALLSDAGHMFTDLIALGLTMVAMVAGQKPPTNSKTFGFYRLEILAALFNGTLLVFISFYIFYEAFQRLVDPREVEGIFMLLVAGIGVGANLAGILVLRKSDLKNLNLKSAFYHLVGDTISSGGVIAGALIILFTGWHFADPIIGILIGAMILRGAYGLVRESVDILLEATPRDINAEKMVGDIQGIPDVKSVHHLHLWTISSGIYAMSAHVLIEDISVSQSQVILKQIKRLLREKYSMEHITIQFETRHKGE